LLPDIKHSLKRTSDEELSHTGSSVDPRNYTRSHRYIK
jgi:hypothetical protein